MRMALIRRGYSGSGGAEVYLKRFARVLAEAGHEPVLFTGAEWPRSEWPHEIHRVQGEQSPWEFARSIEKARPQEKTDVVFSLERVLACDIYRAGDGVHAAWLERKSRFESGWRSAWRRWMPKHRSLCALEKIVFTQGARRVIANSRMVKEEIVSRFGVDPSRIEVIYNGVPAGADGEREESWRKQRREALGLEADGYVALFAGSGWERKGLRHAIQAAQLAAERGAEVTLLVAGRGRRRGLPRGGRVIFLGEQAGLQECLAAADVFILPTIYDPFSNAALEALAAGKPVITTRANGMAEIMTGEDGTVVESADAVNALAEGILRWRNSTRGDSEKRREKTRRFSVETNLEQTLALIGRLWSENAPNHQGPSSQ